MKWFSASCAALVVGMLLAGSVQAGRAGAGRSGARAGNHSGMRAGQRPARPSVRHRRAFRPLPRQLRWQWLPERPWVDDLSPGSDVLIPGGDDPNSGGPPQEVDVIDGDGPQAAVAPTGGNPRQLAAATNRSPRASRSQPRRR
jgi:hypothetical protein